ncbi:MAG: threonylcarbamoyl-AMP synthase [Clostridia bacterium]|jgi:L-threonylcarbamoyladenylate synthase|nr:threonylcarbamoyl-AMP synthase [Clostridia bacterium]
MRVFFAIPIPDSVREKIRAIQDMLKESYGGKYTDGDNLHITLAFIGEVDTKVIDMLTEIEINSDTIPAGFKLSLRGMDSFKDGKVTYLKVEKNAEIERLRAYLEERLSALGIPFEMRDEFCPHVTIRRGKKEMIKEESETLEINVSSFALYESKRVDGELKYVPIKTFGGNILMTTKIMKGKDAIEEGARLINSGGIVAFPTETVYGLGANALDEEATLKIFEAKGRPQDNPLIVHVASVDDIPKLVEEISEGARRVIDAFMPGPITVIMKKSDAIPNSVTAGLRNVGIRMPVNETAREFIRACGCPIAAPSANRSTRISPTSAEHVYEDMNGRIPLIIDGGASDVGIESTIIDMTRDTPTILRPGAITESMLLSVLSEVRTFQGKVISAAPAPGMKYRHYAPRCETVVASDVESAISGYDRAKEEGRDPVIVARSHEAYGDRNVIELGKSDEEVCRNIYSALHRGETEHDYIIIEDFGDGGIGDSVMNRVNKASGGKRI